MSYGNWNFDTAESIPALRMCDAVGHKCSNPNCHIQSYLVAGEGLIDPDFGALCWGCLACKNELEQTGLLVRRQSFQDLAKAAHLQQVADDEDRRVQSERSLAKRRIEMALGLFKEMGIKHDSATIDETLGIVTLDGVRFRGREIYGKCPRCGQEVLSERVDSLHDIGALLVKFQPSFNHEQYECLKLKDQSQFSVSTGKVLADALIAFLRDHRDDIPF